MNNRMKFFCLILFSLFVFSLLVACTSEFEENESPSNGDKNVTFKEFSNDPVTLIFASPWPEEPYMARIGDYMKEKLPHITVKLVHYDGSVEGLEELHADGITPDFILPHTGIEPLLDFKMEYDLDELLEIYEIDLSSIDNQVLESARSLDPTGKRRLLVLPQESGVMGLHYNKEIFDLFGESYPSDDITWEETINLARRMTTEQNGIEYVGLEFNIGGDVNLEHVPLQQLSTSLTDSKTGEVLLTHNNNVVRYMDLMQTYFDIPGIYNPETYGSAFGEMRAAMRIGPHGVLTWYWDGEDEGHKSIDIAPVPAWEDLPGIAPTPHFYTFAISRYSENKEAALQYLVESISEEYQEILTRSGTPAVLNDVNVNFFGKDRPVYQNKQVENFFIHEFASLPEVVSRWDDYVDLKLDVFAQSGDSVPEHLRKVQEESEIKIKDAKASD